MPVCAKIVPAQGCNLTRWYNFLDHETILRISDSTTVQHIRVRFFTPNRVWKLVKNESCNPFIIKRSGCPTANVTTLVLGSYFPPRLSRQPWHFSVENSIHQITVQCRDTFQRKTRFTKSHTNVVIFFNGKLDSPSHRPKCRDILRRIRSTKS